MPESKHHRENQSHKEWKKKRNKKKYTNMLLEKNRIVADYVDKLHKRRYNNPLTSVSTPEQTFSQKMLSRLGIGKLNKLDKK